MGVPWPLSEARLIQYRSNVSAANALSIGGTGPPPGKIWNVLAVSYMPSVAENQVVSFQKVIPGLYVMALMNPVSLNLNPAPATPIEQGMEFFLLPGEYLQASRVAATAGSTITLSIEFIEIDLPIYSYDEPLIVHRQQRALSSLRTRLAGGSGRGSGGAEGPRGGGERGGRSGVPA